MGTNKINNNVGLIFLVYIPITITLNHFETIETLKN